MTPRYVLSIDRRTGNLTVPGSGGRTMNAAFEDVRMVLDEDSFASMVQQSIDTLDSEIVSAIDDLNSASFDAKSSSSNHARTTESDTDEVLPPVTPVVGDHTEVFWPIDNQYYPGQVTTVDDGRHLFTYDDRLAGMDSTVHSGESVKYLFKRVHVITHDLSWIRQFFSFDCNCTLVAVFETAYRSRSRCHIL